MKALTRTATRLSAAALLLLPAACQDGPTGPPAVATLEAPAALDGVVGEAVQAEIRVLDGRGRGIRGIDVALSVEGGGSVSADTMTSGADGVVPVSWILGTRAGDQRLTASAQSFTATVIARARAGAPTRVSSVGSVVREDTVGRTGEPAAARVVDSWDNAVSGHSVTFSAPAGVLSATTATTDDEGVARVDVRYPDVAGAFTVRAQSPVGSIEYLYEALPGAAASLTVVSGAGQTGQVGKELPAPIVVRVADALGNGRAGETVRFEVAGGGGSFVPAQGVTGADGAATARWVLGTTPGLHDAVVSAGSLSPAPISATATPGAPDSVTVLGDGQEGDTGAFLPSPLVVRVADRYGNPVAGVAVTWRVVTGGGSISDASGATDAGGAATATWRMGTAEGEQRAQAVVGDLPPVTFTAAAYGGLTITAASLADARRGWPYDVALTAARVEGTPTWSLVGGALPAGLSLAPEGTLSGTPQVEGTFPVTLRIADEAGAQDEAAFDLVVCGAALDLSAGETAVVPFPERCGVVLPPGGGAAYRVGVMARAYRTSGSVNEAVAAGILLRSRVGTPGDAFSLRLPSIVQAPAPEEPALDPETRRLAEATERLHRMLREEERRRFPAPRRAPTLGPPLAQHLLRADSVPLQRTFFVRDYSQGATVTVPATLRDSSAHVLYYEDDGVASENARATDTEIRRLIEYYDAYGPPIIQEAFGGFGPQGTTSNFKDDAGNVLQLPAGDLDRNGRLIVLQIRPSLMLSGAAAYVTSCDRFPRPEHAVSGGTCSYSNEGEVTYYNRPSSDFYLGSLVHEAKHISSHGWAIFGGRGYNPSWIEEGTAEIAKEKSSRDASALADGEEARAADAQTTREGYGMYVVNARARSFLRASPASGIIGTPSPNPNGSTYYGSSWLLHRYLADTYAAGDEDAFFRTMNTTGGGVAAIEQATGRSLSALLVELMAAVAVEGQPAARAAATTRFRSYDFVDIAAQYAGTWPYALGVGPFRTGDAELSTYYSAPSFFDFEAGSEPMRLDALGLGGENALADDDVAVTVTRIR